MKCTVLALCACLLLKSSRGFTNSSRRHPKGITYSIKNTSVKSRYSVLFNKKDALDSRLNSKTGVVVEGGYQTSSNGNKQQLSKIPAALTKAGMIAYITSMCITMPIALLPPALLHKFGVWDQQKREYYSCLAGQSCARWMLRLIPFARYESISNTNVDTSISSPTAESEPSIWVCNHVSMIDLFFLMAASKKLRGKRPIKIIYWRNLEDNPICRIYFKQCGFIPVDMAPNAAGEANQYDKSGFKTLLLKTKEALAQGFDLGVLPEGQLNPTPEKGLLPVFPGAYTLSKMCKRPIKFMALHGTHNLWHADESIGMKVTSRKVKIRAFPYSWQFKNSDEFVDAFKTVVGTFGLTGDDPEPTMFSKWLPRENPEDSNEDLLVQRKKEPNTPSPKPVAT